MRQEVKDFVGRLAGEIFDKDALWFRKGIDWKELSQDDYNASMGVACMYAYLIGIKPTIGDLSEYIEVSKDNIRVPFQRLLQSGVFSKAYNARNDVWLNLLHRKAHDGVRALCAWGYIAGVASDAITRNYSNMDIKALD
jgi:hypothetical protein